MKAEDYINGLKMLPHPEGGFFKENFKSEEKIHKDHLPGRYINHRVFSTSIYFLLRSSDVSKLHRIQSDEIWYFHNGSPVKIVCLSETNGYYEFILGNDLSKGQLPQAIVKYGEWFGAYVLEENSYSLVGCNVAPGFDFEDFEMGKREYLLKTFPGYEDIILKLT